MGRFDFAESQSRGPWEPWKPGWYSGVILPQFEGGNGSLFKTEDVLSKDGNSRNLVLCVGVVRIESTGFDTTDSQNLVYRVNYRTDDLSEERIAEVREYKEKQGKVKVSAWGDRGMMKAFLTYASLHELERIAGVELQMNGRGFDPSPIIGHNADVRLDIDEYQGKRRNEVKNLEPAGTKVK